MDHHLKWESVKYKDGSTYEGLSQDARNHERGVLIHASGDRYEGEFRDNQYHGFGSYTWAGKSTVYRGQFRDGHMRGCGVRSTRRADGSIEEEAGMFVDDEYVGAILGCPVRISQAMAQEADIAASMARAFQLKDNNTTAQTRQTATASQSAAATATPQAQAGGLKRKPVFGSITLLGSLITQNINGRYF